MEEEVVVDEGTFSGWVDEEALAASDATARIEQIIGEEGNKQEEVEEG